MTRISWAGELVAPSSELLGKFCFRQWIHWNAQTHSRRCPTWHWEHHLEGHANTRAEIAWDGQTHKHTALLLQRHRHNTSIAPQATYRSCSGAVRVTDSAVDVQPISRRLYKPAPTDWPMTNQPYATLVCHLMVSTGHMDYYSFTDHRGMEGWVGLVCWPIADTLPKKWSHVNHRSGVDQGKSASQRPTS